MLMTTALNKLSDRLVQRLVPKTTATACMGPQAGWWRICYCSNPNSCPAHCRVIYQWCDVCAGITSCTGCDYDFGYVC